MTRLPSGKEHIPTAGISFISVLVVIMSGMIFFISIQNASRMRIAQVHDALEGLKSDFLYKLTCDNEHYQAAEALSSIQNIVQFPVIRNYRTTVPVIFFYAEHTTPDSYTASCFMHDIEVLGNLITTFDNNLYDSLSTLFYLLVCFMLIGVIFISYSEYSIYTRYMQERSDKAVSEKSADLLEEERAKIACELHDTVAQKLGYIAQSWTGLAESPHSRHLYRFLTESITDLRGLYQGLAGPGQQNMSFEEKLVQLFEDFRPLCSARLNWKLPGLSGIHPDARTQLHIYRILQELLTNCRKHSQATEVSVIVAYVPPVLRIRYSDNGRGKNVRTEDGFGTRSIALRSGFLHARLITQKTGEGKGFTMEMEVPIRHGNHINSR